MTKKRTLTATFPNGEQVTRTTHRTYTHVVKGVDKWGNRYTKWCGRFDLATKQAAKLETYLIGEVA